MRKQAAENLKKARIAASETQAQIQAMEARVSALQFQEQAAWQEVLEELASVRGEPVCETADRKATIAEIRRYRQLAPVRKAYEQLVQQSATAQRNLQYFVKLAGIIADQLRNAERLLAETDELHASLGPGERPSTETAAAE